MQSNVAYERNQKPRNTRPPAEFKVREEQRERRTKANWERNDQRRRQSDMMN